MSCALTVTEMSNFALTEFAVFENEQDEANDDGRESDRERKRESDQPKIWIEWNIKQNQSNEMMYQIVIVKCVLAFYHCLESHILGPAENNLWLNLILCVGQLQS